MSKRTRNGQQGFTAVEAVIALFVIVVLAAGGWWVWHNSQKSSSNGSNNASSTKQSSEDSSQPLIDNWNAYENKDLGLSFKYPKTWAVSAIIPIETIAGEKGWSVTVKPIVSENHDPILVLDTYPANASIRNVDVGPSDVKMQDISTQDISFTLVGSIEGAEGVTKPTLVTASSCWPRSCTPKLPDGRFLSLGAHTVNNDCSGDSSCWLEFDTSSEIYADFLGIIKTIKTL